MRLDNGFRLSVYLCLVLASLCLTYAEQVYLPAFLLVGLGFTALLALAYLLEGRWALSLGAANFLGLGIAIGAGAWLVYHLLHPSPELQQDVSGPVALLPFVGPVLMVLVAAKLLRPKLVNDFWGLHSLGLLEIVLACVLAGQLLFSLLLAGYLVCLVWSLGLFCLYRGQVAVTAPRQRLAASRPSASPPLPWRWGGVLPAARWATPVLGLGLLLFLLTPQHGTVRWDPGLLGGKQDRPMATGASATIDLNHTGTLRLDDRLAFEVDAQFLNGSPVLDLPPWQRWRGATVDYYEQGRWINRAFPLLVSHDIHHELHPSQPGNLLDLGSRGYTLKFTLDTRRTNRLILADPLQIVPGTLALPVAFIMPEGNWLVGVLPGFQEGEFSQGAAADTNGKYRYLQFVLPPADANLTPAFDFEVLNLGRYCQQPVPRIQTEAENIAKRLIAAGQLTEADVRLAPAPPRPGFVLIPDLTQPSSLGRRIPVRGIPTDPGPHLMVPAANREKVARAFSEYLATSGQFTYSLAHRRSDMNIDPTEDFLCNVKEGHCERFAAALVLLLRSYGIPSRIVLGFEGQEHTDGGHYVIRNSRAHSWVEVMIERPGRQGTKTYYWLALDPVPSGATDVAGETSADLWRRAELFFTDLWRGYVLDYDEDQQQSTAAALWQRVDTGQVIRTVLPLIGGVPTNIAGWISLLVWGVALGGLGWLALRWSRRRRKPATGHRRPVSWVPFYVRLLGLLERHLHLKPRDDLTPHEFAEVVAARMRQRTATETIAVLVEHFYAVRYGGRSLDASQASDIDRRLTELELALTQATGPA